MPAAGQSLWPLLLDGDSMRVERVELAAFRRGELAVVKRPDGILAAHLVIGTEPLRTASTAGVADPLPLEGLGRVSGFRRGGRVLPWPSSLALALRHWPALTTVLRRVAPLRALVRRLRAR
jgi:hypothetical protein